MQHKFSTHDDEGKLANPNEVVFPILKQLERDLWQLIGTGFYITTNGIFVTAKHVLQDAINHSKYKQTHNIAIFHFTSNNQYTIRPIRSGHWNENTDISIGIAAELEHNKTKEILLNKIVKISTHISQQDDFIHSYAYPETKCELKKVYFSPKFYEGKITKYYSTGRDKILLPNRCYETTMPMLGGASGGPVFNVNGCVIAINSTGYNNENLSFVSSIHDIFNIQLHNVFINNELRNIISLHELSQLGHIKTVP